MAATDVALARPARPALRRLLLRHPELGAAVVVAAAWVTLVALDAAGGHGSGVASGGMPGMPGMTARGPAAPGGAWSAAVSGLPSWILMTVAMMGPAALLSVGYTGRSSLRWRRRRAMAEFSAGYLGVWAALGVLALAAAASAPGVSRPATLAVVLAAAAAWQLTPVKRRFLLAAHRTAPLPPRGWRAERGAVAFGLRNGLACVGSCWCLMVVMAVAPGGELPWMAGLTVVAAAERLSRRPRRATRVTAVILGFATVATLALGNLLR